MKKKIALEQLSAYFPYKVKAKFKSKDHGIEIGTVGQISDNCSIVCYDTVEAYPEKYKLLLRPLSWLTDEVISDLNLNNSEENMIEMIRDNESDASSIPYDIMKILLKNHIDLFGLIKNGLAEAIKD
jgi:hypothetical protein